MKEDMDDIKSQFTRVTPGGEMISGETLPAVITITTLPTNNTKITAVYSGDSLSPDKAIDLVVHNTADRAKKSDYRIDFSEDENIKEKPLPPYVHTSTPKSGCFKKIIKVAAISLATALIIKSIASINWQWPVIKIEDETLPTESQIETIVEERADFEYGLQFSVEESDSVRVTLYDKTDNPFLHHLNYNKYYERWDTLTEEANSLLTQLVNSQAHYREDQTAELTELADKLSKIYNELAELEQIAKEALNQETLRTNLSDEDREVLEANKKHLERENLITQSNIFTVNFIDITTDNINAAQAKASTNTNPDVLLPDDEFVAIAHSIIQDNISQDIQFGVWASASSSSKCITFETETDAYKAAIDYLLSYQEQNLLPNEYAEYDFSPQVTLHLTCTDSSTGKTTNLYRCNEEPIETVLENLNAKLEELQPTEPTVEETTIPKEEVSGLVITRNTTKLQNAWNWFRNVFNKHRNHNLR